MPRIRCKYVDCVYLESSFCGTDQIDLDPELGCLTYSQEEEALSKEEEWEEEEILDEVLDEEEEWDEDELEDLDEDLDDEDEDW